MSAPEKTNEEPLVLIGQGDHARPITGDEPTQPFGGVWFWLSFGALLWVVPLVILAVKWAERRAEP